MVTDQEILSLIQSLVAEPMDGGATFPSGQWTPEEVVNYLNEVQQDAVQASALVLKRTEVPCIAHETHQYMPSDWIATQRIVWVRNSDGRHYPLHRSDVWELDAGMPNWRASPGVPAYFTDGDTPTLTVQIAPAADVPGMLRVTYLALPTHFTGAGQASVMPDEPTVGLVWGAISHMLTKDGRAKDAARAQIAKQREEMAIEAVKLILQGWEP